MADQEQSSFSSLPQWPAEARELPGGEPPHESFRALYIGGAIGAVFGFIRVLPTLMLGNLADNPEQQGMVVGAIVFPALIGMAIGYFCDRQRWIRDQDRRN